MTEKNQSEEYSFPKMEDQSTDTINRVGTKHIYDVADMDEGMFLLNWLILGPFPNCENCQETSFTHDERCAGFYMDYLQSTGGENTCRPSPGDVVSVPKLKIKRTWKTYQSDSKIINLQDIFPESDQIVSYAYCEIYSSSQKRFGLTVGSNDGVKIFLNGNPIHLVHPSQGRGVNRDDDFIEITLKKGNNTLLLKNENGYGQFGFIVRLVELGTPLADLIRTKGEPVELSKGDLSAIFIDNYAFGENHRAGYNGIAELKHSELDSNLFVPNYAGFNLEHIFSSDSLVQLFEPRRNPMSLKKISDTEVVLHQPTTPISHVESWTTFKMVTPHYVDVTFRCIIQSEDFFQNNLAGLFWASYINAPPDKKIYFWGRKKEEKLYQWIGAWSPGHGIESTHIGEKDKLDLCTAPGFNVVLANHFSDFLFKDAFYYGRYNDLVFAYLFSTEGDQTIRFSQSPNGGGGPNPAWDFQFIIPDYEVGKKYSFNCRLIYKKFISPDDIKEEFERWQEHK